MMIKIKITTKTMMEKDIHKKEIDISTDEE